MPRGGCVVRDKLIGGEESRNILLRLQPAHEQEDKLLRFDAQPTAHVGPDRTARLRKMHGIRDVAQSPVRYTHFRTEIVYDRVIYSHDCIGEAAVSPRSA